MCHEKDELAARRLIRKLSAFLGEWCSVLPIPVVMDDSLKTIEGHVLLKLALLVVSDKIKISHGSISKKMSNRLSRNRDMLCWILRSTSFREIFFKNIKWTLVQTQYSCAWQICLVLLPLTFLTKKNPRKETLRVMVLQIIMCVGRSTMSGICGRSVF